MEPRCFTLLAFYLPASLIVRTEPQSEIGRKEEKNLVLVDGVSRGSENVPEISGHLEKTLTDSNFQKTLVR